MRFRHLGRSGVMVSVVGVGCNRIGRTVGLAGARTIVRCALDEGINFFDTADTYGAQPGKSEELLGKALAGLWDRVVLGTKVRSKVGEGPNDRGASRYHIMQGVEASLRRLKTDHIDLYHIHEWDPSTPLEETMRALEDLVRSGKVRYLAASNFTGWQLARADAISELRGWNHFVVSQEEYHLLERAIEAEVLPYARYAGLGIVPYFPLAGGLLTGKYRGGKALSETRVGYISRYNSEQNLKRIEQLAQWAEARGHTMGELAIAWLLSEPRVASVISGATNAAQITDNAQAAAWELTPAEAAEVRQLLEAK